MLQAFSHAIDLAYNSVRHPEALEHSIATLAAVIGADAADIVEEAPSGEVITTFASIGFDAQARALYDIELLGANPWLEAMRAMPVGRAFHDRDLPGAWRSSDYYDLWVARQGFDASLAGTLEQGEDRVLYIGFVRRRGAAPFGGMEARLIDLAMPHFTRVLTVKRALMGAQAETAIFRLLLEAMDPPLILLDRAGRIVYCNRAGEELLAGDAGLIRTGDGRLEGTQREVARFLAEGRAAIGGPGHRPSPDPIQIGSAKYGPALLGLVPLTAAEASVSGAVAAVVASRGPAGGAAGIRALAAAFDLTETETRLAEALARGETVDGFAAAQGIAASTARWHLKNLQAKTGTGRLARLLALLHGLRLPIRDL
ncbi:MAG: helix-turn-helix transcriptional regulator [Roseicyclus sp.]